MKCHYEILGLIETSSPDDLKKAYRKLALEWHPDKNLHRLTEATETFQLIQQAYEVLSDPQERAWYDRHKDDILRGDAEGAFKDACINVYQYFNSSCFKGYNDNEKGFYTVYRHVFEEIATEDRPFIDTEDDFNFPTFGYSNSSYEEVHNFYAYWQSYCTARSYSWMDQYDLSDARKSGAGRRVIRMMEKENKKVRDQHKKDRNEEVRELVAFVRKRDKRVQAHKKLQEERKLEKAKQVEELRRQQVIERNKSLENYKESEWTSISQFEDKYSELESTIDATFGGANDGSTDDEDQCAPDGLYCVACEKDFRSEKAMKNHENSKKHKENVTLLKYLMEEEEESLQNSPDVNETLSDEVKSDSEFEVVETSEALLEELVKSSSKSKKKKRKNKSFSDETLLSNTSKIDLLDKETKTLNADEIDLANQLEEVTILEASSDLPNLINPNVKRKILKKSKNKGNFEKERNPNSVVSDASDTEGTEKPSTICEVCRVDFKSRNKLFTHLKDSGHAVYKTDKTKPVSKKKRNKNS